MAYKFETYISTLVNSMFSKGQTVEEIYQTLPLLEHSVIDAYLARGD
ncbi:hypothetical protein [Vibrio sp. 10N.261.52.A1]|nr:hypothetical protein [Vibrio sp. 10N.261.52.A1]